MRCFLLAVSTVAILVHGSSATAYNWDPSCSGDYVYSKGVCESCFQPAPSSCPTADDDISFLPGTVVSFGFTVGPQPYHPVMARTIVIHPTANVTLFNGMLAAHEALYVNGTLFFSTITYKMYDNGTFLGYSDGVGPFLKNENFTAFPDYQLPGFTPNIIGRNRHFGDPQPSNNGTQTQVYVSGQLIMSSSYSPKYAAVFVDITVESNGSITADTGNFVGAIINNGLFVINDKLYLAGSLLNFGKMNIHTVEASPFSDSIFPNITNHGKLELTIPTALKLNLLNMGEITLAPQPRQMDSSSLKPFTMTGTLRNLAGGLVNLATCGMCSDFNFDVVVENDGNITFVGCATTVFGKSIANRGMFFADTTHSIVFDADVVNTGGLFLQHAHTNDTSMTPPALRTITFAATVFNSGGLTLRHAHTKLTLTRLQNDGDVEVHCNFFSIVKACHNSRRLILHCVAHVSELYNYGELLIDNEHSRMDVILNTGVLSSKSETMAVARYISNSGVMHLTTSRLEVAIDFYNEGDLTLTCPVPFRCPVFVEGRTVITGNVTLHNVHFSTSSFLALGKTTVALQSRTTTFALNVWGKPIKQEVDQGHLRHDRDRADLVLSTANKSASKQNCLTCLYSWCYYCGFDWESWEWAAKGPQLSLYSFTPLGTVQMGPTIQALLRDAKFHNKHAILGHMMVKGSGAIRTHSTLEISGTLALEGAQLFSFVEHGADMLIGSGLLELLDSSTFHMGLDAVQRTPRSPRIVVHDNALLHVPSYAKVSLESGSILVTKGAPVVVEGSLSVGPRFVLDADIDRREQGSVTRKGTL